MKLGLIVFSMVLGLFIGSTYAFATARTGIVVTASIQVPADRIPPAVEVPTADLRPRPVAHKVVAKVVTVKAPKKWTCGPMQDNLVGGRNSTCEWL